MIFRWDMPFRAAGATFRAFWAKIRGYRALCTPQEEAERFSECKICPFFLDGWQCGVCGCVATAKCMITTEECPKKRWRAIWSKKSRQSDQKKRTV